MLRHVLLTLVVRIIPCFIVTLAKFEATLYKECRALRQAKDQEISLEILV